MTESGAQTEYDAWTNRTTVKTLDRLCGHCPNDVERQILDFFHPDRIVDVGCGTGHRMFPLYQDLGIQCVGIEKYEKIVAESRFREQIICTDIGSGELCADLQEYVGQFQIAALWGGVLCGMHVALHRGQAFINIGSLLESGGHLVIDTPCCEDFASAVTGSAQVLFPDAPIQYCASLAEIRSLYAQAGFDLLENPRLENWESPTVRIAYLVGRKR